LITVALLHNCYQQPGGEDGSTRVECLLLERAGHRVVEYHRSNDEIEQYGMWGKAMLGARTVWARDSYREVKELLARERPDVAHFHNTFPLISPATYYACREAGVPVVQTLHNYRLLCPAATFRQDGCICEECLADGLSHSLLYGCYRGSRAATATTALMLGVHRWLGTWNEMVDCYIALTEFSRRKFVEGGLPAEKIVVKPNFVYPDPFVDCSGGPVADCMAADGKCDSEIRVQGPTFSSRPSSIINRQSPGYALFVGRLSPEKGARTLLRAWQHVGKGIPLRVLGDGPLRQPLEEQAARHGLSRVSFHGYLAPDRVIPVVKHARFLVFPSESYEGMPRTILEAFACGVPVIASRLGAMQEIIADGRTGLHFTPGDAEDLAAKVAWAWTHPEEMRIMGPAARAEYEAKYTAERNYQALMDIYVRVATTSPKVRA
jgi:glycosyltransferase involved in cell wall biosynthesis